jgi:hypothetical protein
VSAIGTIPTDPTTGIHGEIRETMIGIDTGLIGRDGGAGPHLRIGTKHVLLGGDVEPAIGMMTETDDPEEVTGTGLIHGHGVALHTGGTRNIELATATATAPALTDIGLVDAPGRQNRVRDAKRGDPHGRKIVCHRYRIVRLRRRAMIRIR